ncbi:hypothetical protein [Paenibacillus pabuli]|uniref:hypothetical protein n=1 Tax=Paenibacillus pabuli TaxID=1472 RepID=UPI003CF9A07D
MSHWRHAAWHTDLVLYHPRNQRAILTPIIHRHLILTLIHIHTHPSFRFHYHFQSVVLGGTAVIRVAATRAGHTVITLEEAIPADIMAEGLEGLEDPGVMVELVEISTVTVSIIGKKSNAGAAAGGSCPCSTFF